MRRILILVSLQAICAGAAVDTRKGYDAHTSGNFNVAVGELRKSTQQGNALAKFYLGIAFATSAARAGFR